MANIVLISNDNNFFEYIKDLLLLRQNDNIKTLHFNNVPSFLHILSNSILLINSVEHREETLDLLKMSDLIPCIVFDFNSDDKFRLKCYESGATDYISLLLSEDEIIARLKPAFKFNSINNQNSTYRNILVKNNILSPNNEVYIEYSYVLEQELKNIYDKKEEAVFAVISPDQKSKFLLQPNKIETIILNNIRKNDILISFAANKYFILLKGINLINAKRLLKKITNQFNENLYVACIKCTNQTREKLVNEALNKLHEAIHKKANLNITTKSKPKLTQDNISASLYNFKQFKSDFSKNIENIIVPIFYQFQQKYSTKLMGIQILQYYKNLKGYFVIKNTSCESTFIISTPGFSKIHIDLTTTNQYNEKESKRITLEPEEFTQELLESLLEQFVQAFTNKIK